MLRNTLIFLSESKFAKAVVTRTPLRRMSKRFVPGETVESFVEAAKAANALGLKVTGNFLGEAEHDEATKDHFYSENFLRVWPDARVR